MSGDDASSRPFRLPRALIVIVMALAGYALTLRIFYPGVLTWDAWYVHGDIAKGVLGDWQSPVMTVLWRWIDPIAPGAGSMFLLIATIYWLAFAALGLALARRSVFLGAAAIVLAFAPPAFDFVGIIWRDIMLAESWLLAAALAYAVAERSDAAGSEWRDPWRLTALAAGLMVLAFGLLLRPNGLFAAPILAAYLLWPRQFDLKRLAIFYVPATVAFALLVPLVYYAMLGAAQQHVLHSIFVFDLGGITHFTRINQFPGTWSAEQNAMLINGCYHPTMWDIYWTQEPCRFVMGKLEGEMHVFGTSVLTQAWLHAIATHPFAYLEHRAAQMADFLFNHNLTIWTVDVEHPGQTALASNAWFMALKSMNDRLAATPLFVAGTWLLVCVLWCVPAWRRRGTPSGAFVLGTAGSAILYVATLFGAGVGNDFRYALWTVLAGLAGAVVLAVREPQRALKAEQVSLGHADI